MKLQELFDIDKLNNKHHIDQIDSFIRDIESDERGETTTVGAGDDLSRISSLYRTGDTRDAAEADTILRIKHDALKKNRTSKKKRQNPVSKDHDAVDCDRSDSEKVVDRLVARYLKK